MSKLQENCVALSFIGNGSCLKRLFCVSGGLDGSKSQLPLGQSSAHASAAAVGLQLPSPIGRESRAESASNTPHNVVDENEVVLDDDTDDEADTDAAGADATVEEQEFHVRRGDGAPESKKARTEHGGTGQFLKLSLPAPKHS